MAAPLQPSRRQQALDLLRFPLALVVLTIHTWSSNGFYLQGELIDLQHYPFFQEVNFWIDGFLRGQSVPIYFFISGFVFFLGIEWNRATYRRKLKNRVKTLLIPYLIWNTIAIALSFIKFLPFFSEFRAADTDFQFNIQALLSCFWTYTNDFFPTLLDLQSSSVANTPINAPLWFLRDLMIVVLCTPLLYRLLKWAGSRAVVGLGFLWFTTGYWELGHTNQLMDAFFFFSWGAYLSIHRKDMLDVFGRYFKLSLWAYPLLALSYVLAMHYWPEAAFTIKRLNILAGLLFAYNAAVRLLDWNICKPNAFFAASSFFVYITHGLICNRLCRILFVLIQPESDISISGVYTLAVILTIGLLLSAFYLLKRYTPRLLKVLTGRQ
ncbi:MAG: acyltransferase [Alistipes senegalensis]|nr:acyltransferase [Bacteroides cellulosilyticus]MCM1351170.1 acyltransferase [Alistipes senegalensis]